MFGDTSTMGARSSSTACTFNSSTRRERPSSGYLEPPMDVDEMNEKLPLVIKSLQQKVQAATSAMAQLKSLAFLPQSQMVSSFGLDNYEAERAKIHAASYAEVKKLAESYLMSSKDMERRFDSQRRRMDVLEGRTTRMETLFSEQIKLNEELGTDAIRAIQQFEEDEKRLIDAFHEARRKEDQHRLELATMRDQMEHLHEISEERGAQLYSLEQEKTELSKRLVECRTELHNLQLTNDRLLHEQAVHLNLLTSKEKKIAELQASEQRIAAEALQKETALTRLSTAREELEQRFFNERQGYQQQLDKLRNEMAQKLHDERVSLERHFQEEQQLELERVQTQRNEKTIIESLQKAADTHRKLERERNKLFKEKNELEENLTTYKRRFVAELNRELSSMCNQLGTGLNTALMEVLVRLNSENLAPHFSALCNVQQKQSQQPPASQQQQQEGEIEILDEPQRIDSSSNPQPQISRQQQKQTAQPRNELEPLLRTQQNHENNLEDVAVPSATAASTFVPRAQRNSCCFTTPNVQNAPKCNNCPPPPFHPSGHSDSSLFMLEQENNNNNNNTQNNQNIPPPPSFQQQVKANQVKKAVAVTVRKAKALKVSAAPIGSSSGMPKRRPVMANLNLGGDGGGGGDGADTQPPPPQPQFGKSKQVPLGVLVTTKPWRPRLPGSRVHQLRRPPQQSHKTPNNDVNNDENGAGGGGGAGNKINTRKVQRQLPIGSPLFASTPNKRKQFPTFQL